MKKKLHNQTDSQARNLVTMRKSNLVSYFFPIDSESIGNNFSYYKFRKMMILQVGRNKGQDENL